MRLQTIIFTTFFGLSACSSLLDDTQPKLRPNNLSAPAPTGSIASQQDAAYYTSIQARLIVQDSLRVERYPKDAPFNAADLATNFERIAFYEEVSIEDGVTIARNKETVMRRWDKPIRIGLHFGASVSKKQRSKDIAEVRGFARRLAGLTGLDIKIVTPKSANFTIMFLNRDERATVPASLTSTLPNLSPQIADDIRTLRRGVYCAAYTRFKVEDPQVGYAAFIAIKSELTDRMRTSCIQEEMAQALGLLNDSKNARPSIFNDDEEFALLTGHDELLMSMLYDPRLEVGMTADIARPIFQEIARDLLSTGQS